VNEALIQGVETARAVLTTTPQGQAADAQFVKWLMEHQKEAGVFATVSDLVDKLSDNPAAKMTAQEIAQRVQQAQQRAAASAVPGPSGGGGATSVTTAAPCSAAGGGCAGGSCMMPAATAGGQGAI